MSNTPIPFTVRVIDGTITVGDTSGAVVVVQEPTIPVVVVGGPPGADGADAPSDHTDLTSIGINTHDDIDGHIADTDIHFGDAPVDDQHYARRNAAWIEFSPAGGSGLLSGVWRFNTSTTPPPASGRLQFDTGAYSTVTEIDISDFTRPGVDASNFLSILDIGDRLYIQDETNSNDWVVFDVIGPAVDNTTYFTIPVSSFQEGDFLTNNRDALFVIQFGGAAVATGVKYDMFLENPRANDDIYFFYTKAEIDVQKIVLAIVGSTSATVFISFGTDRDNLSTDLINAGTVVTNTTTGQVITSFDNSVIPVNNFVGVRVTAIGAPPPDQLNVHLEN